MKSKYQESSQGTGGDAPTKLGFLFPTSADHHIIAIMAIAPILKHCFPGPNLFPVGRCDFPKSDHLMTWLYQAFSGASITFPPSIPEIRTFTGGSGDLDDLATLPPANLLVYFLLRKMENEIISGGGVSGAWATWKLHSPTATEESNGDGESGFGFPAPEPGQTVDINPHSLIYHGMVTDGCGNTLTFPIELHSTIYEYSGKPFESETIQIGEYRDMDNTTVQSTGFWDFHYAIQAKGTNGGASRFRFSGTVAALCAPAVSP